MQILCGHLQKITTIQNDATGFAEELALAGGQLLNIRNRQIAACEFARSV